MKQGFFIGHRDAPEEVYPALRAAVREVKERYPRVRLTRLLAYLPAGQERLPAGFDGSLYPEGLEHTLPVYAIVRANRWAVDRTDYLIGYVHRTPSNAEKIVCRAQKKGVPVTLL